MKKFLIILSTLIGILLLGAFGAYYLVPKERWAAYATPEVKYITITDAVITDTITTMTVQLEVTSKVVPVFVDSMVYNFTLFNESLAQGSQKFKPESKTGKVQKLAIPITLDYKKARKLVQRQFLEGEKMQANIDAWCRFPVIGIRKFTFTREVDMAIRVLPGIDLL